MCHILFIEQCHLVCCVLEVCLSYCGVPIFTIIVCMGTCKEHCGVLRTRWRITEVRGDEERRKK